MRQKKYTTVKTYIAFTAKLFSSYYLKTCAVSTAEDTNTLSDRETCLYFQISSSDVFNHFPYKAHTVHSYVCSKVFVDARAIYDRCTVS